MATSTLGGGLPPISDEEAEKILFFKFKGWSKSEQKRPLKVWVWDHGYDLTYRGERRFVCKLCITTRQHRIESFAYAGLMNVRNHLFKVHRVSAPAGQDPAPAELRQRAAEDKRQTLLKRWAHEAAADEPSAKRIKAPEFDRDQFFRLLIAWICEADLPFAITTEPEFRAMLEHISPAIKGLDLTIHPYMVRRYVREEYDDQQGTPDWLEEEPDVKPEADSEESFDSGPHSKSYWLDGEFRRDPERPESPPRSLPKKRVVTPFDNLPKRTGPWSR